MELFCPLDGEELVNMRRQDGHPLYLCWTCGYEALVRLNEIGFCGSCEGNVAPASNDGADYLCGKCRAQL